MKQEAICAVVVTRNRKALLLDCLKSLLSQTHLLDTVYLIDNNSTDGTAELLCEKGYINDMPSPATEPAETSCIVKMPGDGHSDREVTVYYLRMHKNTGGSGGFHEGIKRALRRGYDWLWLMDDDVECSPEALRHLVAAKTRLAGEDAGLLASRVVNALGELLPMNMPAFHLSRAEHLKYLDDGILKIRFNASFVSILISREVVMRAGLPFKDYVVYNDDVEYTSRILRISAGYYVNSSVVTHRTRNEFLPMLRLESLGFRLFYEVRNKIWLLKSGNFPLFYSVKIGTNFLMLLGRLLFKNASLARFSAVSKGLFYGIFTAPRE